MLDDIGGARPSISTLPLLTQVESGRPAEIRHCFPRLAQAASRWHVLGVFVGLCLLQSAAWNFYSPIDDAVKLAYGWDDDTIAKLPNVANYFMAPALPILSYIVDVYGLRPGIGFSAIALFVSLALRVVDTWSGGGQRVLLYASMALNGAAASVLNFAGAVLATTFFGLGERGFCQAIASMAPYVGTSIGFLIGPSFVSSPSEAEDHHAPPDDTILKQIYHLYIIEALAGLLLLVAFAIHFPSRPVVPPSASEEAKRLVDADQVAKDPLTFFRSCVKALCGPKLLVICVIGALPVGLFGGWMSVLALNLKQFGLTRSEAARLGFWMSCGGCIGALLVGRAVDKRPHHSKALLVACNVMASLGLGSFNLACLGVLPPLSQELLYITAITGGFFVNCLIPATFELVLEAAYPNVPAATACCLFALVIDLVQITIVDTTFNGTHRGTAAMNVALAAGVPACGVVFLFISAPLQRLEIDEGAKIQTYATPKDGNDHSLQEGAPKESMVAGRNMVTASMINVR